MTAVRSPASRWPWLLLAVWLLWVLGVWIHGRNPELLGVSLDLEKAGQFGDAFGSLASLMASIAAVGAWVAVAIQQHQLADAHLAAHKAEAAAKKAEQEREIAAKKAEEESKIRKYEETYFFMFQQLPHIVSGTFIGQGDALRQGQSALARIATLQRNKFDWAANTGAPFTEAYKDFFESYSPQIANFFRFVYHCMGLVERLPADDRKFYLKVLFAQFSNHQLLLLVANHCFHPKGKNALAYTMKYKLLHNADFSRDGSLKAAVLPIMGHDYFS